MDKFISIGVRQGDAFYLERGGKKLLVDGGRSRRGFAEQFERTVGATSVDVLVCTHADADHVNGLIGFLTLVLLHVKYGFRVLGQADSRIC